MRAALTALLLAVAGPLPAATLTSSGPGAVSVSVYRNPDRGENQGWDLRWLRGYALVSETRTIAIPAGESNIRFEGVASGILPETAIVTGLPAGVIEKNQDADLLSPRALLDRFTGRAVTLQRTDRATGAIRTQEAVIRSSAAGAIVIETEAGFEALGCTGLADTLVYPEVPAGLSAKPTLSVKLRSDRATTATVTLSYLAQGFDWQASYLAEIAPDGRSMRLFAWMTLASGDDTSFPDAQAQAIAGSPNRTRQDAGIATPPASVRLTCWPQGSTSDVGTRFPSAPPPPPPPPPPAMVAFAEDIVVTGARRAAPAAMTATLEDLGDLKLYRIPEPVTVAARAQKQVALIDREAVPIELLYRVRIDENPDFVSRLLRTRNRDREKLGLPLPSGSVTLFQPAAGGAQLLLGQATMTDRAIGEDVDLEYGEATAVRAVTVSEEIDDQSRVMTMRLTNDRAEAATVEIEWLRDPNIERRGFTQTVRARNGRDQVVMRVPANGSATLRWVERTRD